MKLLVMLTILGTCLAAFASDVDVTVLAELDEAAIAASGMRVDRKTDMPDFVVIYLRGPKENDAIGLYEGAHPSLFTPRGKKLGEVKDTIAGQAVVWSCWEEQRGGLRIVGAEALLISRRVVVREHKEEFVQQFHVFVTRSDFRSLAEARQFVASLFKKKPNQSSEPTSGTVPPRAEPRVAPVPPVAHL
jgi:hypothetical protein